MAGHELIEDYLAALARRLPADVVDELADGLTETYQRCLAHGGVADAAALAAIAEFGEPDVVVAAFVRQAPGRRVARRLLSWGPVVGLCWGLTLATGGARTWPVPVGLRFTVGAALLAVVAMLVLAATGSTYRRTRVAVAAALGTIGLDGAMLAILVLAGPPFVWPMVLAVPASLARLALTARAISHLRGT